MTTIINGSSPSITFSDSTTQTTAALPLTGGTVTGGVNLATSSGNVGIGTATPSTKLNIYGSSPSIYLEQNTGVAGNTQIRLNAAGGANTASIRIQDKYIWNSTANGSLLNFGADLTTPQMQLDSSGNLLVGLTTSSGKLAVKQVTGNNFGGGFTLMRADSTNNWQFVNGSDDVLYLGWNSATRGTFNPSTGAYSAVSDRNLKKNISDISQGLNAIQALKPVEYNMLDDSDTDVKHLGFIAQDAKEILPSSVSEMMGGILGMDKLEIVPVLVKAIQELKAELDATKAEVAALKAGA